MDKTDYHLPGQTYIEQLQKVELLTILLREKVSNPSYMEPILARWYALEKAKQENGWGYDFLEYEVDGEATGFLMGKIIHPQSHLHQVLIFAYGGAAEQWHKSSSSGCIGTFYRKDGVPQYQPVNESVRIPDVVWKRCAVIADMIIS